ncbi:MAG TPA: ABC transporter permease [Chlamydiales bacterium]|nr:ABC transporter permease [Chlamydiales bacterium]
MSNEQFVDPYKAIPAAFAFFFFFWWVASYFLHTPILPFPWQAITQFYHDLLYNQLAIHLAISSYRLFTAIFIGAFLAIPIGLFLGASKTKDAWSAPVIYLFYVIPKIIFFPIFLILVGISDASKIALIAVVVFFQVLVMVRDAAREVDRRYVYSIQSLGNSSLQIFWHVFFLSSLPRIFTALKISLGSAIAVLFLTENFATDYGIGYYIMDGIARFNYAVVFSGILGMSLLGIFLFGLIDFLETRFCPWIFLAKTKES